jgi:hypothetical protein
MKVMLRNAATEDLYELFQTVFEAEGYSKAQAELLYSISDELEKRGEAQAISQEDARIRIERIRRQIAILPTEQSQTAETAGQPAWMAKLLEDSQEDIRRGKAKHKRTAAIAACAIVVVLLSNSISALAGFDFLAWALARVRYGVHMITAQESSGTEKLESTEYRHINKLLQDNDVYVKIPTWTPDGFVFSEFDAASTSSPFFMTAWFTNGGQFFSLQIREAGSAAERDSWMETEDIAEPGELSIVEISGVSYAIADNNARIKAVWIEGDYELTIQGDLTREQITKMLESFL